MIQDLQDIVIAAGKTARLVEALADGFGFGDLDEALAVARAVPAAIKAAPKAWAQYRDMTDEEAVELEADVIDEFELEHDDVEAFIEKALTFFISLHNFAKILPKGVV